ncbi:hypothetical protein TNCV_1675171 [Trichonephila clavipes]|nr:hypothetical protein TNCV_1675171 [Trichonephila clavipes]
MFLGLREKDPQSESGQVDQSERWAIIHRFHGYDASHMVSLLPPFPTARYLLTMTTMQGTGEGREERLLPFAFPP